MSTAAPFVPDFSLSQDPVPLDLINSSQADIQLARAAAATSSIVAVLNALAGPDDQLNNATVRLRMLHPEIILAGAASGGWQPKAPCRLASTANIDLVTGTLLTIDGTVTTAGDRILVKDQTSAAQNGIYIAGVGAWSRAADIDSSAEFTLSCTTVTLGTANSGSAWVCTSPTPTVGVTAITFTQFYAPANGILNKTFGNVALDTELVLTGAGSVAFGRAYKCSTGADRYTVTLPVPASGDIGKMIIVRVDSACQSLIDLDAGAARTIDGSQTRTLWARESCVLRCVAATGVCWVKAAGVTRPMRACVYLGATQTLGAGGAWIRALIDTVLNENTSGLATANRITHLATNRLIPQRSGSYGVTGGSQLLSVADGKIFGAVIRLNGSQTFLTKAMQRYSAAGGSAAVVSPTASVSCTVAVNGTTDYIDLALSNGDVADRTTADPNTHAMTYLDIVEQPDW